MRQLRWASGSLMFILLLGVLTFVWVENSEAQTFGSNWTGLYFDNPNFAGNPVLPRIDAQINFNYGAGSPIPCTGTNAGACLPPDNFSIRWTSQQAFTAGVYRFSATAETGIKVIIDGVTIIDKLASTGAAQTISVDVSVAEGTRSIQVDYVALTGNAAVQFFWAPATATGGTPGATAGPPTATFTPSATGLPAIPPGALRATVIKARVLNVRDAPSLGGNQIGRILRGQTYQIVGRDANARWYLLQLSNSQAWAYGFYLSVDGNEFNAPVVSAGAGTTSAIPPGYSDTGVLIVTEAGMRLRGEPNTVSPQTGRIPWGSFLPVVGRVGDNSWLQVVWKGTVGWVYAPYTEVRQGDLNAVPIR